MVVHMQTIGPTDVPIGTTSPCDRCTNANCIKTAHALREPDALNHRVTLTVRGEMLHAGAPPSLDGILTRSPMETRCSPELLASIQELGELATSEITAYLTRGCAVNDCTLRSKTKMRRSDPHALQQPLEAV